MNTKDRINKSSCKTIIAVYIINNYCFLSTQAIKSNININNKYT